jgi:UDP-glucose 4-epimerase
MVLPNFVSNALKNENLQVFGDGQQTRVFCHVSDVVTAIVKLIDADKYWGEVFNIGGEGEISILQLAERVIKVTKSNSKIQHVPYDVVYSKGFEDMARRVPDTTKLRNAIVWQPTMGLDEIISDLAKHLQAVNLK